MSPTGGAVRLANVRGLPLSVWIDREMRQVAFSAQGEGTDDKQTPRGSDRITAEATQTIDIGAKGVPLVIGTGGATIKMLQSSTGARIDIARGSTTCSWTTGSSSSSLASAPRKGLC